MKRKRMVARSMIKVVCLLKHGRVQQTYDSLGVSAKSYKNCSNGLNFVDKVGPSKIKFVCFFCFK